MQGQNQILSQQRMKYFLLRTESDLISRQNRIQLNSDLNQIQSCMTESDHIVQVKHNLILKPYQIQTQDLIIRFNPGIKSNPIRGTDPHQF